MNHRLTTRRIVEFHAAFTQAHGYPPTAREIKDAMGVNSTQTAHSAQKRCIAHGFLRGRSEPNAITRAVTVTREAKQFGDLRLVWREVTD